MSLKQKLKYVLPVPVKKGFKTLLYLVEDVLDGLRGRRLPGYPPKRLNFVGSSEFKKVGDEFARYFIELGGLKPTDTVLDIGCGIGRMAIPLTHHLTEGALYGFDIDKTGIRWCAKNVSKKFPNFHFQYVDLFNKYYNSRGTIPAEEFVFPYPDKTFDFVFATSVFTHMLPAQVNQYLSEIHRTLKPGGTAFLTFFSIDEEARATMKNRTATCDFKYEYEEGICFYSHKNVPEAETGYDEAWIVKQFKQHGLGHGLKIHHGSWAARQKSLSYQDIFVARKRA